MSVFPIFFTLLKNLILLFFIDKFSHFRRNVSVAMDARLEYGVETGAEISLRRLSTLGVYNLPLCINATVHVSCANVTSIFLDKIEKYKQLLYFLFFY